MKTKIDFIKKHPVLTYFALTFAISWGGILLVVGGPDAIPSPSEQAMKLLPVAILTTPILATLILLALSLLSPDFLPAIFTTNDKASLMLIGIMSGLVVGIFEEIGWTGLLFPG